MKKLTIESKIEIVESIIYRLKTRQNQYVCFALSKILRNYSCYKDVYKHFPEIVKFITDVGQEGYNKMKDKPIFRYGMAAWVDYTNIKENMPIEEKIKHLKEFLKQLKQKV